MRHQSLIASKTSKECRSVWYSASSQYMPWEKNEAIIEYSERAGCTRKCEISTVFSRYGRMWRNLDTEILSDDEHFHCASLAEIGLWKFPLFWALSRLKVKKKLCFLYIDKKDAFSSFFYFEKMQNKHFGTFSFLQNSKNKRFATFLLLK